MAGIKSKLSSIKSKVNDRVMSWMFSEEIETQTEALNEEIKLPNGQVVTKRQALEILETLRMVEKEATLCASEDHSQPPTQSDIDRYYEYHKNYVRNIGTFQEETNCWLTKKIDLLEEDVYNSEATEKGWDFLRMNCSLPTGDLKNNPWKSQQSSWEVTDKEMWDTKE